jgi:two-component SAPR family response regulator
MKITAEFNSNEELLNFISTFGTKTIQKAEPKQVVQASTRVKKVENKVTNTPKEESLPTESPKEDKTESPKEDKKEETSKITKEMIRAIFTKLIKAGKQQEAKTLTQKYGAAKVPDIKEEDYAAIYKEAEELL